MRQLRTDRHQTPTVVGSGPYRGPTITAAQGSRHATSIAPQWRKEPSMNLIAPSIHTFISGFVAHLERRHEIGTAGVRAEQVMTLPVNGTFQIPSPHGCRVECGRGSLWITQYGDCKDVVVNAGSHWVVDRDLPMLIQALEPAQFKVSRAP
jgi:hypothetical protein